jgi:DNA modification methylase
MEINKIINGDSLDFMKTLPDKCIDFVCADFPYNISNY